jgi:hypothetical protein
MRMRIRWLLLIAGLLLAPAVGRAQTGVPPTRFAGPLAARDDGGLYVGFNFIYMRASRPMPLSQQIAMRGFRDLDGATGVPPGTFVGSGDEALNTDQLRGPGNWQPGWDLWVGWKFQGGVALEFNWRHLVQARYHAAAHLLPPDFNTGAKFENTFLFAPVTNFSTDWAGNPVNVTGGTPATTFGIWNAASIMEIQFVQRYDIYSINARIPIIENPEMGHRVYGLFGPRIVWIWERFKWRTVDQDDQGQGGPDTTAIYTNMVSNRMYGVHFGFGNDWYLGTNPLGAFSFELDFEGGLYLDLTKTKASYVREDRFISSSRARRFNALVPAAEIRAGFKWYVWEGITLEAGYDIQAYFNTIASPRPVDFNLSSVDPEYRYQFFRWYHGMRFGIGFTF